MYFIILPIVTLINCFSINIRHSVCLSLCWKINFVLVTIRVVKGLCYCARVCLRLGFEKSVPISTLSFCVCLIYEKCTPCSPLLEKKRGNFIKPRERENSWMCVSYINVWYICTGRGDRVNAIFFYSLSYNEKLCVFNPLVCFLYSFIVF